MSKSKSKDWVKKWEVLKYENLWEFLQIINACKDELSKISKVAIEKMMDRELEDLVIPLTVNYTCPDGNIENWDIKINVTRNWDRDEETNE